MKIKQISIITTLLLFTYGAAIAQAGRTLNLKKGQKFLVENKSLTQSTTEVQGQQMEVKIDATATYEIEVTDVKDNQYHLSNKITNIKMNMSQMGQEMNFDSDKEEDLAGPLGAGMKEMLNVIKKVVVSNEGRVLSTGEDSAAVAGVSPQLRQFEESGYGAALAFQSLPGSLKVGQSWQNSSEKNGTVKNTTYNVKSVSGKLATIDLQGDMNIDTKMQNMGMDMVVKSKGTFKGDEVVETSTGVIQSQNMVINTDGNIEVMGQELPTSAEITTNTTVKAL